MKRFLDALRAISSAVGRAVSSLWRRIADWLSVSSNFCVALIAALFAVSLALWIMNDHCEEAILFFPDGSGELRGELRDLPRARGSEARAELVSEEILLGPRSAGLVAAFEPGAGLSSALYRDGRLFVDIGPVAALAERASLERGLAALRRSLELALPGLDRLTITIGGKEPYLEALPPGEGNGAKNARK